MILVDYVFLIDQRIFSELGMLVALLTVSVLIFRFSWEEFYVRRQPWRAKYFNRFVRFFITGITVLVVAVPEGLPLAVTVSLAYAVKVKKNKFTCFRDRKKEENGKTFLNRK